MRSVKLNVSAWANTSGIFMGIVYVFCSLAIALFPEISRVVAQSWIHGIDLSVVWTGSPRGNFLLGLVTAAGLSWVAGWLFAWLYNKLIK